jgi:staphylococcal nuclease domain-containing protein 1
MKDFAAHHKTARAPTGWTPKTGELVSAQFSEDDQWYRAKVKRSSNMKQQAEVRFID